MIIIVELEKFAIMQMARNQKSMSLTKPTTLFVYNDPTMTENKLSAIKVGSCKNVPRGCCERIVEISDTIFLFRKIVLFSFIQGINTCMINTFII